MKRQPPRSVLCSSRLSTPFLSSALCVLSEGPLSRRREILSFPRNRIKATDGATWTDRGVRPQRLAAWARILALSRLPMTGRWVNTSKSASSILSRMAMPASQMRASSNLKSARVCRAEGGRVRTGRACAPLETHEIADGRGHFSALMSASLTPKKCRSSPECRCGRGRRRKPRPANSWSTASRSQSRRRSEPARDRDSRTTPEAAVHRLGRTRGVGAQRSKRRIAREPSKIGTKRRQQILEGGGRVKPRFSMVSWQANYPAGRRHGSTRFSSSCQRQALPAAAVILGLVAKIVGRHGKRRRRDHMGP